MQFTLVEKKRWDAPDFLTVSARPPRKALSAEVMNKGLSTQVAQPIVRHARKPTRNGWIRWLPGLDMAAHIIINCEDSETTLGNDFPLRHREAYPEAKSCA